MFLQCMYGRGLQHHFAGKAEIVSHVPRQWKEIRGKNSAWGRWGEHLSLSPSLSLLGIISIIIIAALAGNGRKGRAKWEGYTNDVCKSDVVWKHWKKITINEKKEEILYSRRRFQGRREIWLATEDSFFNSSGIRFLSGLIKIFKMSLFWVTWWSYRKRKLYI